MEWSTIIQEIGGGLPAVVIAGLGYVAWAERKRGHELMDRMLERERQHSSELIETIRVVETAAKVVERRQ
jgi:hypothetical protein